MCGRYFWDDDAEDEFAVDFPRLAGEVRRIFADGSGEIARDGARRIRSGDYTPAMQALAVAGGPAGVGASFSMGNPAAAGALFAAGGPAAEGALFAAGGPAGAGAPFAASNPAAEGAPSLHAAFLRWGFPGFDNGKLLINARAESVKERPTFAESFALRRCVLPAAGFYEWDRKKEKVIFTAYGHKILYLAGIYRPYGDENRFVVLTREANASMEPVHDRMPLILSKEEVAPWVCDAAEADGILTKELPQLQAVRPYEQMTFSW